MTDGVPSITDALSQITEHWQPHRLTTVNDDDVKMVKIKGAFVCHTHPDTEELFLVHSGDAGGDRTTEL